MPALDDSIPPAPPAAASPKYYAAWWRPSATVGWRRRGRCRTEAEARKLLSDDTHRPGMAGLVNVTAGGARPGPGAWRGGDDDG
jgi:hypothetical protein